MKIVIVGLGGVGGIVGGRLATGLADDDYDVVFWCRGETLDAVSTEGLHILGHDGKVTVRPALATHDAQRVGEADLLLFATKNYHLEAAAQELAPLATEKTTVIPLLNGVSATFILEKHFPKSDVLGGCVYISAHVEKPGTVRQVGTMQRIFFGKKGISEANNRLCYGNIEQILRKSGVNVTLTDRIDVETWSKFVFLSPFAGVTTLFRRSISEALSHGESSETVSRMIRELESLARAKNVDLPENISDITIEKARAFAPLTKTSMQLDQEKDRPTELEALIGYVCKEGEALKLPTPTYNTVYESLKNICRT
ncbi:MAG: 2-dehydropantoate 2-reductase [Synergistaceae bacterium]|jgi:2-dehydropantoate 2-reductase|nr:2-dehydropantoate 2-reductase [Synergistaceae bacterium]